MHGSQALAAPPSPSEVFVTTLPKAHFPVTADRLSLSHVPGQNHPLRISHVQPKLAVPSL